MAPCTNCMAAAQQQLPCNYEIDYSQVQTDPILPFTIQLNLQTSILEPAPGQNQRFCYDIQGVGEDTPAFADLSHIVFGICNQIPLELITNITVVRNGVEEPVIIGDNVELRTEENPDPPTGCPGLKFDFGLNKVNGTMSICFELTTPFAVGPNPVCLFGGDTPATGLSICGPICSTLNECPATGYQTMDICVPVTVTPYADVGITTTYCCGTPTVTPGAVACPGIIGGSCTFTISQRICVAVPITFGATAQTGDMSVACVNASAENICADCIEE